MCDQGERGARGFVGYDDAVKHIAQENGISPSDKRNIHDMMRIPKTETHLKVFRCLFCDGGKLFVGMSEESFLDHVSRQHGAKAATKRPQKLQRECRICSERFDQDLPLTRHIKKTHIEEGEQNRYPFVGFGPKEDMEEDDVGVVEVMEPVSSSKRKEKMVRRRSRSSSSSYSESDEEESIRRGIAKAKRKRQRLESELLDRRQEPERRQDPEIGPETFFFVCALCGKKDLGQFDIFEHLDTEHGLGEDESVLAKKTFRPRAVLACRYLKTGSLFASFKCFLIFCLSLS